MDAIHTKWWMFAEDILSHTLPRLPPPSLIRFFDCFEGVNITVFLGGVSSLSDDESSTRSSPKTAICPKAFPTFPLLLLCRLISSATSCCSSCSISFLLTLARCRTAWSATPAVPSSSANIALPYAALFCRTLKATSRGTTFPAHFGWFDKSSRMRSSAAAGTRTCERKKSASKGCTVFPGIDGNRSKRI